MQTQVSVPRVIRGVAIGFLLVIVIAIGFPTKAHAHGGGDIGRAFAGVVAAAGALAVIDTVMYRRGYAQPGYIVVQPQPIYVVRPQCYMLQRPATDAYGNQLYVSVNGQMQPVMQPVQVCE